MTCSTMSTIAPSHFNRVLSDVSVRFAAIAGIIGLCGKSTRRKTIPSKDRPVETRRKPDIQSSSLDHSRGMRDRSYVENAMPSSASLPSSLAFVSHLDPPTAIFMNAAGG